MNEQTQDQQNELLFMQVVMMFQGMALQNLGKVMNPVTNEVERNLEHAKNMIDILGMLESKTQGNLNENEKNLLEHALFELRMNYVDETKKGPDTDTGEAPETSAEDSGSSDESESSEEEKDA